MGQKERKAREKIPAVLGKNARIDTHELAMLLNESGATVMNETADTEKENAVRGCHTLTNWENASNERVGMLIGVNVTPQRNMDYNRTMERIYQYNEVDSVCLMSGAFDFVVLLEDETIREVILFISKRLAPLESVTGTSTHFVLRKYKDHGTETEVKKEDEG